MSRYIDADLMKEAENEAYNKSIEFTNGTENALPNLIAHLKIQKLIDDTQTTDVVEVVRCNDCKHSTIETNPFDNDKPCTFCNFLNISTDGNVFCSFGERRIKDAEIH